MLGQAGNSIFANRSAKSGFARTNNSTTGLFRSSDTSAPSMWQTSSSAVGSQMSNQKEAPNYKVDEKLSFDAYVEERITDSMVGEEQRIRHFTINFFTADETLEIWEKKQSNSGMDQGKFLRRCDLRVGGGGRTGRTYTAMDFALGSVLRISGLSFNVCKCTNAFTEQRYRQIHGMGG